VGEEDEASEGDDEDEEDEEDGEKEEEGPAKEPSPKRRKTENQNVGSSRAALHPISEGSEEDAGHFDWDRPDSSAHWDDHDAADNTPLSVRLRQLKEVIEPAPLEVILPPTAKDRKARLRLPETPKEPSQPPSPQMKSSSAATSSHKRSKSADDSCQGREEPEPIARSNSMDFTPPEINIMKWVEEEEKPPSAEQISKTDHTTEPGYDYWDGFDEDALREIEENALKQFELKKSQVNQDAAATSSQGNPEVGSKEVEKLTPPADVEPRTTTDVEPSSVNSSVAPAFHPAPRRVVRKTRALKSPYTDAAPRKGFKCSKEVRHVYDMILKTHLHPPRNRDLTSKEYMLIPPIIHSETSN
jgi:hypothetical protein